MKKLALSLLTLLSCQTAYPLPHGNPMEPSLFLNGVLWESCASCDPCDPCFSWWDGWSFRGGFYGDFVFNRHLKGARDKGDPDDDSGGRHVEETHMNTNAAYVALNFCDRVDLFATLGATELWFRTNSNIFKGISDSFETEFRFGGRFSWSIGARAALWECCGFGIGLMGQYFSFRPDLNYFVDYSTGEKIYFDNLKAHFREWQMGIGVSYRIATPCPKLAFVPYTAVKYSSAHFDARDVIIPASFGDFELHNFRLGKHWGWVLGLSFTMCDLIGVTTEARYGDEKAFHVSAQIRI